MLTRKMNITPRIIKLFKDMSELTAPECSKNCKIPHSCCSPEYCEMAEAQAAEHGVVYTKTDHPTLPFMGPTGCVVAPHHRVLCTLHTCAVNNWRFKPGDEAWTKIYFDLREQIEEELSK